MLNGCVSPGVLFTRYTIVEAQAGRQAGRGFFLEQDELEANHHYYRAAKYFVYRLFDPLISQVEILLPDYTVF